MNSLSHRVKSLVHQVESDCEGDEEWGTDGGEYWGTLDLP